METATCSGCRQEVAINGFSKSQLKNRTALKRRCKACVAVTTREAEVEAAAKSQSEWKTDVAERRYQTTEGARIAAEESGDPIRASMMAVSGWAEVTSEIGPAAAQLAYNNLAALEPFVDKKVLAKLAARAAAATVAEWAEKGTGGSGGGEPAAAAAAPGQDTVHHCGNCGTKRRGMNACSKCKGDKTTYYCDSDCQRSDWKFHKKYVCMSRDAVTTGVMDSTHRVRDAFAATELRSIKAVLTSIPAMARVAQAGMLVGMVDTYYMTKHLDVPDNAAAAW